MDNIEQFIMAFKSKLDAQEPLSIREPVRYERKTRGASFDTKPFKKIRFAPLKMELRPEGETPPINECLLYPWTSPTSPDYSAADLPATVVIDGVQFVPGTGFTYNTTGAGGAGVATTISAGSTYWEILDSGSAVLARGVSLIGEYTNGYIVVDEFLNIYHTVVSYGGTDYDVSLARQDLINNCTWGGNSAGFEVSVDMYYNSTAFAWVMNVDIVISGNPPATGLLKADPQNSPEGLYGGTYTVTP